ncbi:MAG TPA: cyclase family protein [Opitutaceae bacterium]
MTLIDISRPIFTGMPHWPGDADTEFLQPTRIRDGASANVGRLTMSVHAGTHLDAPYHYNDRGLTADALDPAIYVGPARVIDARGRDAFTPDLFADLDLAATPRVLFRTDTWTSSTSFPTVWPLLAEGTPAWLAARGVRLIGLDVPSVDTLTSDGMPRHLACDAAGLLILENLDLQAVAAGVYELIALPLRIAGGDGSPVRAVLRRLPS